MGPDLDPSNTSRQSLNKIPPRIVILLSTIFGLVLLAGAYYFLTGAGESVKHDGILVTQSPQNVIPLPLQEYNIDVPPQHQSPSPSQQHSTAVPTQNNNYVPPSVNKDLPIVGAIRWDAWHDGQVGREVERNLSPKKWRDRVPFFGKETIDGKVVIRADTVAVMDKEISYAKEAGLSYWAFLTYEPMTTSEMSKSFRLYLSSSRKNDINFALILNPQSGLLTINEWPTLVKKYVNYFKDPSYQKVAGGRPLIYIFPLDSMAHWAGSESEAKNVFDKLRDATLKANLPAPYFVAMSSNAAQGAYYAERLGLDAISAYADGASSHYQELPYSALAKSNRNFWEAAKGTGKKVIPIVSAGWDPRPRWEIPVSWDPNPKPGTYYAQATPDEIALNLKSALDWNAKNPEAAEANAVIIYAWNEIDEGGWLLPSNPTFNSVGTAILDAIGKVILK